MKMQYVRKFNEAMEIPYEQDTRAWHTWIDISQTTKPNEAIDVDKMMKLYGTDWSYYRDILGQIAEDGHIEAVYSLKSAK